MKIMSFVPDGFFERYRPWYSLFNCRNSSSAYVFGISIFGNPYFHRPWFKATVYRLYRVGLAAHNSQYWLMYRLIPKHQYHIVRTGLKPGYYDHDTLILHACFAELGRYIEFYDGPDKLDEFSKDLINEPDPNAPEGMQDSQAGRQMEATTLWRWWTIEKPADEKRRDELLMKLYGNRKLVTKPTENPRLSEIVFPEFKDDKRTMREEFRALEKKIDNDEQAMLHRLIDIRQSLWT